MSYNIETHIITHPIEGINPQGVKTS